MLNLLRAEWQKVLGNSMLASFTVWIFPIGVIAFILTMIVFALVNSAVPPPTQGWQKDMVATWGILTVFPSSLFMHIFPLAFFVSFLSGEYEWDMLKHILPHVKRTRFLLVKMLVLPLIMFASLGFTSLLYASSMAVPAKMTNLEYGELNWDTLSAFAPDYFREACLAFAVLLLLVGFAGVMASLTRSFVGGLLLSFGLSIFDSMSVLIFMLISVLLGQPDMMNFYVFMPSFQVENIRSWLVDSAAYGANLPLFTAEVSLMNSVIMLAVWIVGLFLLSLFIFKQQDIT